MEREERMRSKGGEWGGVAERRAEKGDKEEELKEKENQSERRLNGSDREMTCDEICDEHGRRGGEGERKREREGEETGIGIRTGVRI